MKSVPTLNPIERGRAGKILFCVNSCWNVVNFRGGLVRALIAHGYEVVVVAPEDEYVDRVEALGCRYVDLPMSARGRKITAEAVVLARFIRIMRREKPDYFLSFTPKPTVYGSFAAWICGVPAINNITGLGHVENEAGPTAKGLKFAYRFLLARASRIFLQNPDDMARFIREGLVPADKVRLLPGSGVDLDRFRPAPRQDGGNRRFVFVLIARLLWEKGIGEYVEAGRMLRAQHRDVELQLAGFFDADPRTGISNSQIEQWAAAGDLTFLGPLSDVRPVLAAADCVVLPSYYREGTPRTLLEAAASGKPIITCDMPGCRNAVDDGVTGLLVTPRNPSALAESMARMIDMSDDELSFMGQAGRAKVERDFGEGRVIDSYLEALRQAPIA